MTIDPFFRLESMTEAANDELKKSFLELVTKVGDKFDFLELVTKVSDKLEKLRADYDRLRALYFKPLGLSEVTIVLKKLRADHDRMRAYHDWMIAYHCRTKGHYSYRSQMISSYFTSKISEMNGLIEMCSQWLFSQMCSPKLISCIIKEGDLCVGGRRVVDAIVVSAAILLSFVYLYLLGYIDRGGSKAGSSGSLDFRDIYISIDLFQAAYVWIKFRDVIPLYKRPNSNKFEPRIKLPVPRGVGDKSKRIRLGSYDTRAKAEYVYQIAAFYCNKPMYRLGRLNLGGGAYYFIPHLSVDRNLPYHEQVNQVGDQVLRVYAEFEEWNASQNLPPHVPRLASEMPTGEGEVLTTSLIPQPQGPLTSQMDSAMPQPAPNIHNGVDSNNPSSAVLPKIQHELREALKKIDSLKARISELEGLLEQSRLPQLDSDLEEIFDRIEA